MTISSTPRTADNSSMIDLIALSRDHKGSARWLEPAMERIRAMGNRWGGGGDALVDTVWQQYAAKSPALGLWVGVKADEVVGHCLADIRGWDGKAVAWVLQMEVDEPVNRAYRDYVLKTIDEWALEAARVLKVVVDRQVMATPRMVDSWARLSGFTPFRVLHERPIPRRG